MLILGKDMLAHERAHFDFFDRMIVANHVRPTILIPLWRLAGLTLGASTGIYGSSGFDWLALLGKEAAMACTEAVETAVGKHYNECDFVLIEKAIIS